MRYRCAGGDIPTSRALKVKAATAGQKDQHAVTNHLCDALIAPHSENDATFLAVSEIGRPAEISFRAFVQEATQMAHVLRDHGVRPGGSDRCAGPEAVGDTGAL